MTCPEVARLLGDAPRSVEYWVRSCEQKDLAGLREGERTGRPRRLNKQQLAEINAALRPMPREVGRSGNLEDGKTLAVWIEQQYGITLGVRQCQRLFRQRGFRLRQPRPRIAYADAERQKAHKKTPRADGRPERRSLGQRRSTLSAAWLALSAGGAPGDQGSILRHHPTRRSVGYLGVVRLRDGRFWSCRATGKFNAVTFGQFMNQLRQVSRLRGCRVVVIADNARYHRVRLHQPWPQERAHPALSGTTCRPTVPS